MPEPTAFFTEPTGAAGKTSWLRASTVAVLGDPAKTDLDHRLLNGLMFLAILTGVFSTVQNLALGASFRMTGATLVCTLAGIAGYLAARRTHKPYRLKLVLFLFFLGLLVFCWITQAGSHGTVGYYFVLLAGYSVALFAGRAKIASLLLTAATASALLLLEHYAPATILPHATPFERFADVAFAIPFCLFMAAAIFHLVHREYRRERQAKDQALDAITAEKERVERAMREKQRLLTIVSHDIANALTVLQGELSLTRFAGAPKQPAHVLDLDRMAFACANIDEIISSVRMLDAMEQGQAPFVAKPVDLASVFEYAEVIFGRRLQRRRMRFELPALTPETRFVMAEPRILANQVFGNLLSNAIKFSYPDSTITLSVTRQAQETIVRVSDRGIGIPTDFMDGLFTLEAKTTRAGTDGEPGTGFGLRTVKHFVELFGGRLAINSRAEDEHPDDHGTSVDVHLKSGTTVV
jgi:signal transduction histidine kinase